MRKTLLLITVLALLLSGCLGFGSQYTYDGTSTALELVIKRDAPKIATLSSEQDQYVYVQITKENDYGDIVYETYEKIPVNEITSEGYALSKQVPAEKGYSVIAAYFGDTGNLEAASQINTKAPAKMVTTVELTLEDVEYKVEVPEVIYSGGSTSQFKIVFPEKYEHIFKYGLYIQNAPWYENGDSPNYYPSTRPGNFGPVFTPTDTYYQFQIHFEASVFPYMTSPKTFLPDLNTETELPSVLRYPSP